MKLRVYIGIVLMAVLAGCGEGLPRPAATLNPPNPLSKGEGPAHMTSPRPSPGGEGVASRTLVGIDSLMWQQPDSALAVMLEFAASPEADSMDVFEGHYCQVLIAELLYKNYYKQSNRKDLLKAVHYFDSIVNVADGRNADARGASVQRRDAFLAARAHYINGVGFYERDSVVAACGEYLKALEIVETHFPGIETQDVASLQVEHLPRFMDLTYCRLAELFSDQFMQEPAIVCCKKALAYKRIEPVPQLFYCRSLEFLGRQYSKLNLYDSAAYCFDEALRLLPDTNNLVYRDVVSQYALLKYETEEDGESFIQDLKCMMAQAADESERLTRYLTIGAIYMDKGLNDSALKYLTPVFMYKDDDISVKKAARCLREIYQSKGDTEKAAQFAMYQAENESLERESNALASRLNDMFQSHIEWEKEKAETERKLAEQEAARQRWRRGLVVTVGVLMVLGLGLWWWTAKRRKEHEAETQTLNEEKQLLQTQRDDALQQLQTVDDALQQLQTQADDALQQVRAMLPQRVADLYRAKVPNRLERIMAEFEAAYPKALERLAAAHPELNEVERQIAVLNFLHFRAKEEADLTGYTEGTTLKYRSNLNKKAGSDPISALLAEGKI